MVFPKNNKDEFKGQSFFKSNMMSIKQELSCKRNYLRGSIAEYLLISLVFLSLAAAYTNWVILDISNKIFVGGGGGDATAGFLWLNTLSPGLSPVLGHTDVVDYPSGENLSSPTHITYAFLLVPMRILAYITDPVAALNIMTIVGFVLAAMTTYWLLKRLTGSIPTAIFAGFAVAFVPYSLMKGSAHLSYIYSGIFVLLFAAFIGFWQKPTFMRAILFALSIALAFYTDGYFILLATVMVVALCTGGVIYDVLGKQWRTLIIKLRALIVALLIFIVAIIPLGYVQLSEGDKVQQGLAESRSDIAKEFEMYQTELLDFIVPVEHPVLSQSAKYQKIQGIKNERSNPSENSNYLGVIVVIIGSAGLAIILAHIIRRDGTLARLNIRDRDTFLLVGTLTIVMTFVFLSFMFSPNILVAGQTIYLPGQILLDNNISLWRVMSRFFIPLHVVLVIFAAYSAWVLLVTRNPKKNVIPPNILAWVIMLSLTGATAVEYLTNANRPSFEMSHIPKTYHWIREQKDIEVIAELPVVSQLNLLTGDYLTHQLVHGKKLVNDRTGSEGGTLGYYGTTDNPETIDFLRSRGAQAIVVSAKKCDNNAAWGELIYTETVPNIINSQLCTYRLNPASFDPFYIRTKEGILTTPLFSENYEQTSVIEKTLVKLEISRFDSKNKIIKPLKLSMILVPVLDTDFDGTWSVLQDDNVLARGEIIDSIGKIEVNIGSTKPISIVLRPTSGKPIKHAIGIQNLIVDQRDVSPSDSE